jgi:leucyl-tRNA synthetase
MFRSHTDLGCFLLARLALAEAGDGIEDANLEETVANSAILRLYELRKWSKDALEEDNLRTGEPSFFDKLFDNDLRGLVIETKKSYEGYVYIRKLHFLNYAY